MRLSIISCLAICVSWSFAEYIRIPRDHNLDHSRHTSHQRRSLGGIEFYARHLQKRDDGYFNDKTALDLLGLPPTASASDINKAHRQFMLKNHPDKWVTKPADKDQATWEAEKARATYIASYGNEIKDRAKLEAEGGHLMERPPWQKSSPQPQSHRPGTWAEPSSQYAPSNHQYQQSGPRPPPPREPRPADYPHDPPNPGRGRRPEQRRPTENSDPRGRRPQSPESPPPREQSPESYYERPPQGRRPQYGERPASPHRTDSRRYTSEGYPPRRQDSDPRTNSRTHNQESYRPHRQESDPRNTRDSRRYREDSPPRRRPQPDRHSEDSYTTSHRTTHRYYRVTTPHTSSDRRQSSRTEFPAHVQQHPNVRFEHHSAQQRPARAAQPAQSRRGSVSSSSGSSLEEYECLQHIGYHIDSHGRCVPVYLRTQPDPEPELIAPRLQRTSTTPQSAQPAQPEPLRRTQTANQQASSSRRPNRLARAAIHGTIWRRSPLDIVA